MTRGAAPWGAPFWRALRLRCPHCGGRPIFVTWIRMLPTCPVCGLNLERGERGYWLGAYFFSLVAVEITFTVWIVGAIIATWPAPPWHAIHLATIALMIVVPVAFFPFSKTLFLAFDLLLRPPTPDDFQHPPERHAAHKRP